MIIHVSRFGLFCLTNMELVPQQKKGGTVSNIREIAKKANVGIATVSRYINNTGYVSEQTAKKIDKVIKELDYTPNALAKAIFSKKNKTIGLMVPNVANPFFSQLANEIEMLASINNYTILLCNTNDDPQKELDYLQVFKEHRVAGIIVSRTLCPKEYLGIRVPVVTFENPISDQYVNVSSDNYLGGQKAFRVLYNNGARRLLHIRGANPFLAVADRYNGFMDEAKKHNLKPDVLQFDTDFSVEMLNDTRHQIVDINKYDGVFVFNDIMASLIIRDIHKSQCRIPEDIQVVGYDNSYICELLSPALSTLDQKVHEIAENLINALFSEIKGQKCVSHHILVEPSVVERMTTDKEKT